MSLKAYFPSLSSTRAFTVSSVVRADHFLHPLPDTLVLHREDQFYPAVKVAGHPVGAAQIQLRISAVSKRKIRLCSSNWPTRLSTVIFSLTPGTPGVRQQIPRTTSVIGTPGLRRFVQLRHHRRIGEGIHLGKKCPRAIPGGRSPSPDRSAHRKGAQAFGAATSRLYRGGREYPVSTLNREDASAPKLSRQVNIPISVYCRAVESL